MAIFLHADLADPSDWLAFGKLIFEPQTYCNREEWKSAKSGTYDFLNDTKLLAD
jgi:phage/plasmid-associated DNA primase